MSQMSQSGFQIYSLGCKVNQYDAAVLKRELARVGFRLSKTPRLVVVSTCAVTQRAITKDRQLINHLRRIFPQALLVVTGCWPQTDEKIATKLIMEQIIFWGVGRTKELIKTIKKSFPPSDFQSVSNRVIPYLESGLLAPTDRSRYFLKVGDGCNQFCAYCLIPFARGHLTSRPISELILEAKAALQAGYQEIVLSGIHLGQYGQDLKDQSLNLTYLLKQILTLPNLGRIRLSSIEINEVTPALVKLIVKEPKICRHLHISLQSGSDKILRLMGRPYTTKYFVARVASLRRVLPTVAITTDIIVGFPGETEADFLATYKFSQRLKFSKIHVFSFSLHEKTQAANLLNQVPSSEIKKRSQKLRSLSQKLEGDYQQSILKKYHHKTLEIIVDGSMGTRIKGKTEFSFTLEGPRKEPLSRSSQQTKIVGRLFPIKIP